MGSARPAGMTPPSLRAWMRDGWAILFSHPDDFVSSDLEMDRWLVITRRAFAERQGQRFAMIIDNALRIRKMFTYSVLTSLPSPLELLGWADALRAK